MKRSISHVYLCISDRKSSFGSQSQHKSLIQQYTLKIHLRDLQVEVFDSLVKLILKLQQLMHQGYLNVKVCLLQFFLNLL